MKLINGVSAVWRLSLFGLMVCVLIACEAEKKPGDGASIPPANSALEAHIYADGALEVIDFSVSHLSAAFTTLNMPVHLHPLENLSSSNLENRPPNQVIAVLFSDTDAEALKSMETMTNTNQDSLGSEGYQLVADNSDNKIFWVRGKDAAGTMYGGLELAEQISLHGLKGVEPKTENPYMAMRGVKFNIPLDVRTPSYTDMGDAGQENIATVWDYSFWTHYLDRLAEYRYNFVSLWNLHPFPSMVKLDNYPDIALDNVQRSTTAFKEYYSTQARGYDDPEILNNVEIVKTLSMEEKIAFWRKVMEYAKSRNITFYVVTWNIFTYGTEGKYGITDAIDNPETIQYFRESVSEMFSTYPLLGGIGLTTGENMPDANFAEKEEWAYRTYGLGVLDAAKTFPDRKITFIHRQHQAGASDIARKFSSLLDQENIDFIFSFKYAQAHVYSSTKQHFHHDFLGDIGDMKTIWTLRNDDVYLYRWAAPEFVRDFILNIPYEVGKGYYLGSDQYIWGRDFLDKSPQYSGGLEIDKHWLEWLIWGRLGYNPHTDQATFSKLVAKKLGLENVDRLFSAWQDASMIYPVVTGFHWGEYDFQWYIEACNSRPGPAETDSGFHDVNRFITLPPHQSTDYISIPDYVAGVERAGTTPPEVVALLHRYTDSALKKSMTLKSTSAPTPGEELSRTLEDIHIMALLGKYYAYKIEGATALALYREKGESKDKQKSIEALENAAYYWEKYTKLSETYYKNPVWFNRVGHVDWDELTLEVAKDIDIARQAKHEAR